MEVNNYIQYQNEINELLKTIFPKVDSKLFEKYDITPATFERIAEVYDFPVVWVKLNDVFININWEYDLLDEEIFDKLISDFFGTNLDVLIITDEAIRSKKLPVIKSENLRDFVMNYERTFFDIVDVIIADVDFRKIFLLHHEGFYTILTLPSA